MFNGLEVRYLDINVSAPRCLLTVRDLCAAVQRKLHDGVLSHDMGPAVCGVCWNEHRPVGRAACGCCVGPAKEIAQWPYIRTGREREGHGGAVEPETAQGLLCGGVHLVVRSWDVCLSSTTGTIFNRLYSLA